MDNIDRLADEFLAKLIDLTYEERLSAARRAFVSAISIVRDSDGCCGEEIAEVLEASMENTCLSIAKFEARRVEDL